jgi:hypothetical protein
VTLSGIDFIDYNKTFHLDVYGYKDTDIVVMLDGGMTADPNLAPTRENIVSSTLLPDTVD